jgi:hypothetical protein
MALVLATATLVWLEAEAIWVEAATPARTRTATKARTMFFIIFALNSFIYLDFLSSEN